MASNYQGNIISATSVTPSGPYEDDAASGVWSLSEAAEFNKAGLWPTAGNVAPVTGIYAGGLSLYDTDIQSININSLGNSSDFGDLFLGVSNQPAAASSATRYLYAGGFNGSDVNTIQYGNYNGGTAADFGDMTVARNDIGGLSNSTRAVFGGHGNVMDYVTIASTGNATDFGDMPDNAKYFQGGACSNDTRGIYAGGSDNTSFGINAIVYITIASTGNAIDFGDLLSADRYNDGVSSTTRAVFLGFAGTDQSEYVTIATTGNAAEFGDLAGNRVQVGAGTSNGHGGLAA